MTPCRKRLVGTAVAIACALIAVTLGSLWWRSLFLADVADHATAVTTGGFYGCRHWTFLSGGGFVEVGRVLDQTTNAADSDRVRAIDQQSGLGWQVAFPVESVEGDRWEIFTDGLRRLAWYRAGERHGWTTQSGRYLEVPYGLPFIGCVVAPATAMVRRRRRLRREGRTTRREP